MVQLEQPAIALEMLELLLCRARLGCARLNEGAQCGIAKEKGTVRLSCGNTDTFAARGERGGTERLGLRTHTTHPCRKAQRLHGDGEETHSPHHRVTAVLKKRLTI
jgi:hypothetical protein